MVGVISFTTEDSSKKPQANFNSKGVQEFRGSRCKSKNQPIYSLFMHFLMDCNCDSLITGLGPVILDPADPAGVVGEGSCWDLIACEADPCSHEG